jgi:hypothetical protein
MNSESTFSFFLKQPYPFYYEGKKLIWIVSVIFLISFFFNYLLQPFDVNSSEHKMDYFWISVIHSFSPIAVLLCFSLLFRLFPAITDSWTMKKECITVFLLVLFTGITQFLIRDIIYDNPLNGSWRYFREEVANSLVAGFFLAPIIIFINLNHRKLINKRNAERLSSALPHTEQVITDSTITISTEVKSEKFTFCSNTFLYAKAEGNYAEIYLKEATKVHKVVKRITIKNLEAQLSPFPFIIKTHRSVVLNLNHIEQVAGNAQGYKVTMKDCPDPVPVSRNFIQAFDIALSSI